MSRSLSVIVLMLAIALPAMAMADDTGLDPLLELLVRKGVITQEEAQALQTEADAEESTPAVAPAAPAAEPAPASAPALKGLKIGTTTYLSYQDGQTGGDDFSQFRIKRGYVDIRQKITDTFSVRLTPDVTQDSTGDIKVRMKYAYGQFQWDDYGVLGKPKVEFGIAHMPWLDFEESVNRYRMQDTMFLERNGIFNSADAGVMFGANLGRELDEGYRTNVNSHYAGRWGSFQVGVYNGGGYHSSEANADKVVEGRLTLRPLPDVAPGLQLSVLGLDGKGNVADTSSAPAPDWTVFNAMVSHESPRFTATGQWYTGDGNQKGGAIGADGTARRQEGWSLYTEVKLDPARTWAVFGRYDRFDGDADSPSGDAVTKRSILGLAWWFHKSNAWVLDYDRVELDTPGSDTDHRLQLTLQIKY
jgi:hypothetical protein